MITVNTYIKTKCGFFEIHDFTEDIEDYNYIEGALELTINGINLLDKSMWDYIDQLWSYIADGVICISNDEAFEIYYPDQPIKISFIPEKGYVFVSVVCHSEKSIRVDKKEFICVMSKSAIDFFDYLSKKNEVFNFRYNELISKLDKY